MSGTLGSCLLSAGSTSLAVRLASAGEDERRDFYAGLTQEQAHALYWDWHFWARPEQIEPPGEWNVWLILAGRGFGKTRTGAETIRRWACGPSPLARGRYGRFALVAETAADARDVLVEGQSGLLAIHPGDMRPKYEASKRRLTWPNGAVATLYSAEEPDQLRGPEHDAAWCDELAKWKYCQDTWDMLQFGLRLGADPRVIVTTTPRPIPTVRELLGSQGTHWTRGRTIDNRANLAPKFLKTILEKYENTRLGRQELNAEMLDDAPGSLWTRTGLDVSYRDNGPRLPRGFVLPNMRRVVVAIDPSGAGGDPDDGSNAVGIVVAGLGEDGIGYVLKDATMVASPEQWGRRVVGLYDHYKADLIVAERNFGGAMVESTIRTVSRRVNYRDVVASRGKSVRAEPVAALYEQGRVRHVGALAALEDQMVLMTPSEWLGRGSPDRLDALVWAITELMLRRREDTPVAAPRQVAAGARNWGAARD